MGVFHVLKIVQIVPNCAKHHIVQYLLQFGTISYQISRMLFIAKRISIWSAIENTHATFNIHCIIKCVQHFHVHVLHVFETSFFDIVAIFLLQYF